MAAFEEEKYNVEQQRLLAHVDFVRKHTKEDISRDISGYDISKIYL